MSSGGSGGGRRTEPRYFTIGLGGRNEPTGCSAHTCVHCDVCMGGESVCLGGRGIYTRPGILCRENYTNHMHVSVHAHTYQ